jgi:integrase
MASFKKDGVVWRVQVYVKGLRDSGSFNTKAAAQAWAAAREIQLRTQATTGVDETKTCADLFDRYEREVSALKQGKRWEALRLRAFARSSLASIRLVDLCNAHIATWRDARLTQVKPATVDREMNLLSHCFSVARTDWNWMRSSPTKDVRRPKKTPSRKRRVSEEEADRICLALGFDGVSVNNKSQAVAVAFLFGIETAMRAGEICSLLRGDRSKEKHASYLKSPKVAHLGKTKNGDEREVPLSPRAIQLLKLLPLTGPSFFGLTTAQLDALFRKGRDRAAVDNLHFHDTRHEAISRLAKKMEVVQLARMVGHRNLNELLTYYHPTGEELAELLA